MRNLLDALARRIEPVSPQAILHGLIHRCRQPDPWLMVAAAEANARQQRP